MPYRLYKNYIKKIKIHTKKNQEQTKLQNNILTSTVNNETQNQLGTKKLQRKKKNQSKMLTGEGHLVETHSDGGEQFVMFLSFKLPVYIPDRNEQKKIITQMQGKLERERGN